MIFKCLVFYNQQFKTQRNSTENELKQIKTANPTFATGTSECLTFSLEKGFKHHHHHHCCCRSTFCQYIHDYMISVWCFDPKSVNSQRLLAHSYSLAAFRRLALEGAGFVGPRSGGAGLQQRRIQRKGRERRRRRGAQGLAVHRLCTGAQEYPRFCLKHLQQGILYTATYWHKKQKVV